MSNKIKTFVIGDKSEKELKELDIEVRKNLLSELFFQLGRDVLGLEYEELGECIESLFFSYNLSKTISDSDLEKIIKEINDHEAKHGTH